MARRFTYLTFSLIFLLVGPGCVNRDIGLTNQPTVFPLRLVESQEAPDAAISAQISSPISTGSGGEGVAGTNPENSLRLQKMGSRDQLFLVRTVSNRHKKVQIETKQLTQWPFEIRHPQISPDGRWVAFLTPFHPGGVTADGVFSLVLIPLEQNPPVMRGYDLVKKMVSHRVVLGDQQAVVFSNDGRFIFYVQKTGEALTSVSDGIFATDLETGNSYLLPTKKIGHRDLLLIGENQIAFSAQSRKNGKRRTFVGHFGPLNPAQTELTQNRLDH